MTLNKLILIVWTPVRFSVINMAILKILPKLKFIDSKKLFFFNNFASSKTAQIHGPHDIQNEMCLTSGTTLGNEKNLLVHFLYKNNK